MKKKWIVAICLLAVLILAAGAVWWFFLRAPESRVIDSEDTESPYPYSYETTRGGWLLTITGDLPEGYRWGVGGAADVVRVTGKKSRDPQKTVFFLEPVGTGETELVFSLAGDPDLTEGGRLYEITVRLRVSEAGKILLLRNFSRAIPAKTVVTGAHFTASIKESGTDALTLVLNDPRACEWSVEILGNAVTAGPVGTTDGGTVYSIGFLSLGQSRVRLHNVTEMDETLELYLTTDQLGRISLVSATVTPSTYSEEESGESRLDRLAAAINLPAGTAVMDKKIVDLILPGAGENGGDRTVGVAFLSLWIGDEKWLLYISDEMDKSAFAEDILRTANASEAVPGQNYGATVYAYVDGSAAIWEDTRGFCFLLKGAHPDLAGTVSVTQSFFDVNN